MTTRLTSATPLPITLALSALLAAVAGSGVAAQQPGPADLDPVRRAYPAEVVDRMRQLLERARSDGLPSGALADKALEGAAKGVPGDRLLAVLEDRRSRLARASEALGTGAGAASVKAGATALGAGLKARHLRRIGKAASDAQRPAALAVLAELHALGVPADPGLDAVVAALARGADARELMALGTRTRRAADRGASLRKALRAGGRGTAPGPGGLGAGLPGIGLPAGVLGPPVPQGAGPPGGEGSPPGAEPPGSPPGARHAGPGPGGG